MKQVLLLHLQSTGRGNLVQFLLIFRIVSEHWFHFKVASFISLSNKIVTLYFPALKPGIDFSSPSMKVLDSIFLQQKTVLPILKICHFSVATCNSLSQTQIIQRHFYPSTCWFTWHVKEMSSFLIPHESTMLSSNISSATYFPLSDFMEFKRVKDLFSIRFWLKGILWLV